MPVANSRPEPIAEGPDVRPPPRDDPGGGVHESRPPRSLRAALGRVLAAVLLPLLAAGGAFLVYQWRQQRETAVARLQDRARTLQRAVDRELSLDLAVLRTLAASGAIDRRDWRAFHALSAEAARARPGSWFVLYERSGQMVVNSRVPLGTSLPNFRDLRAQDPDVEWEGRRIAKAGENFLAPFETGRPSFTGLIYAPLLKRPAVVTVVPVLRDGAAVYALSLVYSSRFFEELLRSETAPESTAVLLDQRGSIIARNRDSERYVGRASAVPVLHGTARSPPEGVGEVVSIESVPSIYAYSRSAVADYVVAAALPRTAVLAPAWRALWLSLVVLLCAGVVGAIAAVRLWRRVGTPLIELAHRARSVGEPHGDVAPTGIEEVEALRAALRDRSHAEQALQLRDAQFQTLIEELRSGVALIDARGRFTVYNRRFLEMFGLSRDADVHNVNSQDWSAWQVFDEAGRLLPLDEHPVRKVASTRQSVRNQLVAVRLPAGGGLVWMLVSAEPLLASDGGVEQIICTYYEITERKRAEEALRETEERYRLLFQNMLDGFAYCRMIYDEGGRAEDFVYLAVNDAFARLTGLRDVVGKKVTEVVPGIREAHPELLETYGRVARTGRAERFEMEFVPLGIWLVITVYRPQEGHFVAIFDNITDRKRAEEALRAADRRKDEFLSAASHELRTPLATMSLHTQGLARMLSAGAIDEASVRRKLASVEGQLARLNRLVGTLLDVSRISGGRLHLEREPCDLADLAADVVERFEEVAARSGTRCTLQASSAVGAWDRLRLEQVLTNLLDNAVKYAPGSPVEVAVAPRSGEAILTVRDSGPGISPESQARIFQQYERAAGANVFGGLGLGLWITRQIVEAHGGSITVESALGAGSTFTVRLPMAPP